jgi:ferredoxin--NADP+ reductase
MNSEKMHPYVVAVIGAGPAGLFAARQLVAEGMRVVIINRDIKPGGLAEYGIYPTKYKMKEGLRKQFRQVIAMPEIDYYGNITVGQQSDITLDELRAIGFNALLVTVGAQGTKWLGLPGEDLVGVYHAKDLVYHYNQLPPYCEDEFALGRRVALVGVGNVMLDIARWLIRNVKVDEVIAVARRGPAEVKFDKKELEYVAANLDLAALDEEMKRMTPIMEAVNQDVTAAKDYILSALPKAVEPVSDARFRFDFCASPTKIIGDEDGNVTGLEVEDTKLIPHNGDTKARGLDTRRMIPVDTVIFCIGDKVDENHGLPVKWNEFIKNPNPHFPVEGISYEAFDPEKNSPIPGTFVAGWSREASSGLVGLARKDGERGARAVSAYLKTRPALQDESALFGRLEQRLVAIPHRVITKEDVYRLAEIEAAEAARLGVEDFKFCANEDMLAAIEQADAVKSGR